jgi:hypothetical protein
MISASKTTFSHYNLKILRPKVTKNIKNLRKKFREFPPCIPNLNSNGRVGTSFS